MTLRKFLRQSESVRKRHAPRMLYDHELHLRSLLRATEAGTSTGEAYESGRAGLSKLVHVLSEEDWLDGNAREALNELKSLISAADPVATATRASLMRRQHTEALLRSVNRCRYRVLTSTGVAPADWDMQDFDDPGNAGTRLPLTVWGESIRSPFNVGSIIRSAEALGAESVAFTPDSASPDHSKALRSAMGAECLISVGSATLDEICERGVSIVALESGGIPVSRFPFPPQGVLMVGNEELGLTSEARRRASASAGILTIPMRGAKGSLNVGAAAAIALSWWGETIRPLPRG